MHSNSTGSFGRTSNSVKKNLNKTFGLSSTGNSGNGGGNGTINISQLIKSTNIVTENTLTPSNFQLENQMYFQNLNDLLQNKIVD